MERQIMDPSDDIAYSAHGVEDSIATGALDPIVLVSPKVLNHIIEQTRAWYGVKRDAGKLLTMLTRSRREHLFPAHFDGSRGSLIQLKNIIPDSIGHFYWSVETAIRDTYGPGSLTRYSSNIATPKNTNYEIVALRGIAVYFVMAPCEREPLHQEEFKIVSDLINVLMVDSLLPSDALESQFLAGRDESTNDNERLRVAIDQVASLIDNSALASHSISC